MEDNNVIQKVEWEERCPICKEKLSFEISKGDNRTYKSYIRKGCKHFCEGYVDQSKYRQIVHMLREMYENPDLLYATMKKREQLEKARMLGIDISKYI